MATFEAHQYHPNVSVLSPRIADGDWKLHEAQMYYLHSVQSTQASAWAKLREQCESVGCNFRPSYVAVYPNLQISLCGRYEWLSLTNVQLVSIHTPFEDSKVAYASHSRLSRKHA